jgi:hypothetical protein
LNCFNKNNKIAPFYFFNERITNQPFSSFLILQNSYIYGEREREREREREKERERERLQVN